MNFSEEVQNLFSQYKDNIRVIREESTLEIFDQILKNPTSNQIVPRRINQVQIGKFYIIRYNFNGNRIWCPILTIPPLVNKNEEGILEKQLKFINNKRILYAVNLDYLPLKYKAMLIDTIISNNQDKYERNENKISKDGKVEEEANFQVFWVYNFLKSNAEKQYSVTAYDISKIEKIFAISSTLLHRFVFVDTYNINKRMMYDTLNNIQDERLKSDFSKKIKMYEEILKIYEKDVEYFYKALRTFEQSLKLTEGL